MFKPYAASSWYWIVASDESQVYSSALPGFVPAADAGYLAWLEEGGIPTRIASLDDLRDVLLAQHPAGWVLPLPELKATKTSEINAACSAAIICGFSSGALGAAHTYTCTFEDQANLTSLIVAGIGGNFTCTDAAGVKARRPHTDAQLKALLADGRAHIEPKLDRARQLKDQVQAAADAAALAALEEVATFEEQMRAAVAV